MNDSHITRYTELMAKKSRTRHRTNRQPTPALVEQAEAHLQARRFRDALEVYKQLLKRESHEPWREALAEAYIGRAEQLAAKGMYKEAAALWENMASSCGERQLERYLEWLIKAGRIERGARLFTQTDASFRNRPEGQRIASYLAVELVCGHEELKTALPADSPLLQQLDTMLAAMQAYCDADATALQAHLKAIPFRSPYRELRLLLHALATLDHDPKATASALQRLPADSPLTRFAELIGYVTLRGEHLLATVLPLPPPERDWVLTLKGWSHRDRQLIKHLPDLKTLSPKQMLQFALGAAQSIDAERLRAFCVALLPYYPSGRAEVEQHCGALTAMENAHIQALANERSGDFRSARHYWNHCIKNLLPPRPGSDDALKAALIYRHVAKLHNKSDGYLFDSLGHEQQALVNSLELDPGDKPTYLRLIDIAAHDQSSKSQDYWIEQAVKQFPQDAEILMSAAKAAYRRQAFKKAASFANTLLQRDPINASARRLLVDCHLGHARKRVKSQRYDLVERELAAAFNYAQEAPERGLACMVQGLVHSHRGDDARAIDVLQQGMSLLGGGLLARFICRVEGRCLAVAPRSLDRYVQQVQPRTPEASIDEVMRLVAWVHRYLESQVKELDVVLQSLRRPLQTAAQLNFSESQLTAICEAFYAVPAYEALTDYASVARQRFSQPPRFVYYDVFARSRGQCSLITAADESALDHALESALEGQDLSTAAMIEDFLDTGFGVPPGMPREFLQFMNKIEDLMDELDTDDPRQAINLLNDQLQKQGFPSLPLPFGPDFGEKD